MAIDKLTRIYTSPGDLQNPSAGVLYFPILSPGELTEIKIKAFAHTPEHNAASFRLNKNGVEVAALTLAAGDLLEGLTGLAVALAPGDEITLDFVSGRVSTPLTLELAIDDGEAETGGGVELPAGDLNPATNTVERIRQIAVAPILAVPNKTDNFDGTQLSGIWTKTNNAAQENGVFRLNNGDLRLNGLWDISERFIIVKRGGSGNGQFFFYSDNGFYVAFNDNAAGGGFRVQVNFSQNTDKPFDPANIAAAQFLRYRHAAGNFYFDTSPDREQWTNQITIPVPGGMNLNACLLFFRDASQTDWTIDDFETNIGATPLEHHFGLWYDAQTARLVKFTLAELKAALAALP